MKIERLDNNNEAFAELVNEVGSVFLSSNFLDAFATKPEVWGVYEKSGKLVAAFAVYENSLRKVKTLSAVPFAPHFGLCYTQGNSQDARSAKREKEIMRAVSEFLEKRRERIVYLSLPPGIQDTQPFIWSGFSVSPRYTYRINLKLSVEELMEKMDKGTRNLIRQGEKNLKLLEADRSPDLITETFKRKGIAVNHAALHALFVRALENNFGYNVSVGEDSPMATAFCLHDAKVAYYVGGGGDADQRHPAAGTYAVWHAILHAKNLGLEVFDFEGSMVPGIESFFRGFGGELVPYYNLFRARGWASTWLRMTGFKA